MIKNYILIRRYILSSILLFASIFIFGKKQYELVNSSEGLTDGYKFLVEGIKGVADYYAIGNQTANERSAKNVLNSDNIITVNNVASSQTDTTNPFEFTLQSANLSGYYKFYDEVNDGFLFTASTANNYLRTEILTINKKESVNYNSVTTMATVNISDAIFENGDYKTVSGTGLLWSNANHWQMFNGIGWNAPGLDGIPSSTRTVYIFGEMSTNGSRTINKMIIEEGGMLTVSSSSTSNTQTFIKKGGLLKLNASFTNNGLFEIQENGILEVNNYGTNINTTLWNGVEKFDNNSIVKFNYARRDALLFSDTSINNNSLTNAKFGNLIIQPTSFSANGNWTGIFPNGDFFLTSNNLVINNSTDRNFTLNGGNLTIGENFIVSNNNVGDIATRSSIGDQIILVNGDFVKNGNGTGRFRTNSNGNSVLNIDGNLTINDGVFSNLGSGGVSIFSKVNLKGNLYISKSGQLISNNSNANFVPNAMFNFVGQGNIQTVNVVNQNTFLNNTLNINSGAQVKIINQNLSLGTNTSLIVKDGAILDFGFSVDDIALNVTNNGNNTVFTVENNATLKITSPEGITAISNQGNVQVPIDKRNYSGEAIYHYIGKVNQTSGNGLPSSAGGKKVIIEMEQETLRFSVTPNSVKRFNSNGSLEIRRGIVLDGQSYGRFADAQDANPMASESGNLIMKGGRYVLYYNGAAVPHLSGDYDLTGGIIEFAGANQSIRTSSLKQYLTMEITGQNIGTPSGNINLKSITNGNHLNGSLTIKKGGSFLINNHSIVGLIGDQSVIIENGGVFKTGDAQGFSGTNQTSIQPNVENIVLEEGSMVEYSRDGNQVITSSNVTLPQDFNYQSLVISGTGTKAPVGDVYVNEMTTLISSSATVEIPNDITFYALGGIENEYGILGNFIVNNDANLIQHQVDGNGIVIRDNANNSKSNITVKRNTSMKKNDYTYWGSPVEGQNLRAFSPGKLYTYNEWDDYFTLLNGTENFDSKAKGYAIQAGPTHQSGISTAFNGVFLGKPKNGNIVMTLKRVGRGYNLIGNPYPSNIDFKKLYEANSDLIYNTAYFWTNLNHNPESQGSNYPNGRTINNYAILNGTGGVPATNSKVPSTVTNSSQIPNEFIKVGQGFIVRKKAAGDGDMIFNNAMRSNDNTGHFFRKKPRDRYWLELKTPLNIYTTLLVGYIENATNDFEIDYDATLMAVGSDAFYSVLGTRKLGIQGRASFVNTDVVALGTSHHENGEYTISAPTREGIFTSSQSIYLKDKQTGITTDLTKGDYTFTANKGLSEGRFEIVYLPDATLDVVDVDDKQTGVFIYKDGAELIIRTLKGLLRNIEVYDSGGRLILRKVPLQKEFRIINDYLNNKILFLKINTDDHMLIKKIKK